jgi:hypothetical protein
MVDLAVLRVQNFSPLIFIALFCQPPQNSHTDHRLIAPDTCAFLALGICLLAWLGENFFNFAFLLSVDFPDAHQTSRLS